MKKLYRIECHQHDKSVTDTDIFKKHVYYVVAKEGVDPISMLPDVEEEDVIEMNVVAETSWANSTLVVEEE